MRRSWIPSLLLAVTLLAACGPAPAPQPATPPAYHTCPMHPSVRAADPGACPLCGMPLEPIAPEQAGRAEVRIDPDRVAPIGLRTVPAERRRFRVEVRALGRVAFDERDLVDVTLRYRGWIGELFADRTGQLVRRGERLVSVYSPDLEIAQRQYLGALDLERQQPTAGRQPRPQLELALRELRRWNVAEADIRALAERGQSFDFVPIVSPVGGRVIERLVRPGKSVEPGETLYRLASLERVSVDVEVYLDDLRLVSEGTEATVRPFRDGGEALTGKVAFVYPWVETSAPSGRVRVDLDNPDLALLPGEPAEVVLTVDLGERLVVPEEAVLYAGTRRVVFVEQGPGLYEPRRVELGARGGPACAALYEIRSGIEPGEVVVTSANFLIGAESRLQGGAWELLGRPGTGH